MPVDAEEAAAAVGARFQGVEMSWRAQRVSGTDLWSVAAYDAKRPEMPEPGALLLVGPDGRVWSFSSNPNIHEGDLCIRLVRALYAEGLADHVEEELLAHAIRVATESRTAQERQILASAAAGELRAKRPRTLP